MCVNTRKTFFNSFFDYDKVPNKYALVQQCLVRFLQADKIIFLKLWFFWLSPPGAASAPWSYGQKNQSWRQ